MQDSRTRAHSRFLPGAGADAVAAAACATDGGARGERARRRRPAHTRPRPLADWAWRVPRASSPMGVKGPRAWRSRGTLPTGGSLAGWPRGGTAVTSSAAGAAARRGGQCSHRATTASAPAADGARLRRRRRAVDLPSRRPIMDQRVRGRSVTSSIRPSGGDRGGGGGRRGCRARWGSANPTGRRAQRAGRATGAARKDIGTKKNWQVDCEGWRGQRGQGKVQGFQERARADPPAACAGRQRAHRSGVKKEEHKRALRRTTPHGERGRRHLSMT